MLNTFKNEIRRSFVNKQFIISLCISGIIVLWYSVERIPFCIENNRDFINGEIIGGFFEVSYLNWIGSHNMFLQQNIFYLIIPFLAVVPYGNSFFMDINQGYIKGIFTRTNKSYYLISKYFAVFFSGGCAVVLPMIVSFLISAAFLPTMMPESSYIFSNIYPIYKWADLLFTSPFVYLFLYLLIHYIFAGLLACTALTISYFSSKSFLVLVFPFFVYIISSLALELLNFEGFSIRFLITTTGERGDTLSVIIMTSLLLVLSFVPYYCIGVRRDVL